MRKGHARCIVNDSLEYYMELRACVSNILPAPSSCCVQGGSGSADARHQHLQRSYHRECGWTHPTESQAEEGYRPATQVTWICGAIDCGHCECPTSDTTHTSVSLARRQNFELHIFLSIAMGMHLWLACTMHCFPPIWEALRSLCIAAYLSTIFTFTLAFVAAVTASDRSTWSFCLYSFFQSPGMLLHIQGFYPILHVLQSHCTEVQFWLYFSSSIQIHSWVII